MNHPIPMPIRIVQSRSFRRARGGFTLVEMLVVIGIMLVLMGILLPTIFATRRAADRKRTQADLGSVIMALEEYKKDFNDYPRQSPTNRGDKSILVWGLMGPFDAGKDGADGLGFRTVNGGKVWGPYLPLDKFMVSSTDLGNALYDRYGAPIEYFPRIRALRKKTNSTASGVAMPIFGQGTAADYAISAYDGLAGDPNAVAYFRKALGDTNFNDLIDSGETMGEAPAVLLLSRGPRKTFSGQAKLATIAIEKADEISNLVSPQ